MSDQIRGEHFPWCAAAQNMARPRSLQLVGPLCTCEEFRESIQKTKRFLESDEGKRQMAKLCPTETETTE